MGFSNSCAMVSVLFGAPAPQTAGVRHCTELTSTSEKCSLFVQKLVNKKVECVKNLVVESYLQVVIYGHYMDLLGPRV